MRIAEGAIARLSHLEPLLFSHTKCVSLERDHIAILWASERSTRSGWRSLKTHQTARISNWQPQTESLPPSVLISSAAAPAARAQITLLRKSFSSAQPTTALIGGHKKHMLPEKVK